MLVTSIKLFLTQFYPHMASCTRFSNKRGSGDKANTTYMYFDLIFLFVSRYPAVAYLECDPGQCEFTCAEVLSLHVLKEPVLGPSYTHQRPATRYLSVLESMSCMS
jgi:hypothetical protein